MTRAAIFGTHSAAVAAWNALTGNGPGTQPGQTVLTTGSGGSARP
jgi:hypothetical protein